MGRYLRALLRHWPAENDDELVLYFNGGAPDDPALRRPRVHLRPSERAAHGLLWQEIDLPRMAASDALDVFFAPAYACPLRLRLPRVTVVHDISFWRLPQDFAFREALRRRLTVGPSLGASARVVAVSDFTRREILALRPELGGRVVVVAHGADDDLPPAPPRDEARRRLGLDGPCLLTVGSIFNRRRLPELLRAVARLRPRHPRLRLHVVGDNRTQPRADFAGLVRDLGLTAQVRFEGFLDEPALALRYAAADAAVFLSDYEGFGLPAMEAAARGVPLVVSARPALAEIFGPAALVVDAEDVDGVARALDRAVTSHVLRDELARRGRALAAAHAWADCARRTRAVLAQAAATAPRARRRRLEPPRDEAAPRVSVVIVSYNTREDVLDALRSLRATDAGPLETIVVDNASADGSADAVRAAFPEVTLIRNAGNVGFGAACNQALRVARAPRVLLLNPDARLLPGALAALLGRLEAERDLGAIAPLTRNPDGTPQVSFGPALGLVSEWRQRRLVDGVRRRDPRALAAAGALVRRERSPDWLSAACLLLRTQALREVGGFDEDYFLYEEDADLGLRLRRAGWRLLHFPGAEATHVLGGSTGQAPARTRLHYQRSHLVYYRKHLGPPSRLGLRLLLLVEALGGLVLGRGPGVDPVERRAYARALLRLTLGRGGRG